MLHPHEWVNESICTRRSIFLNTNQFRKLPSCISVFTNVFWFTHVFWCEMSQRIRQSKSSNILAYIWKYWCYFSLSISLVEMREKYYPFSQWDWFNGLTYHLHWWCCWSLCCLHKIKNKSMTKSIQLKKIKHSHICDKRSRNYHCSGRYDDTMSWVE